MRRLVLVAVFVLGGALAAYASADRRSELPLKGKSARGQEWQLQAASGASGTWCLTLRYSTGVTIDGERFGGSQKSCGPRPAPRVSGEVLVDCERGSVFVYGAARTAATHLRIKVHNGTRKPLTAALSSESDFEGRTFIAVGDVRELPAKLTAAHAGSNPIVRIGRRSKVCKPYPGAPNGGEAFFDFKSSK